MGLSRGGTATACAAAVMKWKPLHHLLSPLLATMRVRMRNMARFVLRFAPNIKWHVLRNLRLVTFRVIEMTRVSLVGLVVVSLVMPVQRPPGIISIRIPVPGLTLPNVQAALLLHIPSSGTRFVTTP